MAGVVSKAAGVVFSPSSTDHKSAARRYSQHRVCTFPNGSLVCSRACSDAQSLKLSCGAPNSPSTDFYGRRVATGTLLFPGNGRTQMSIGIAKAQRWWEKGLQPNMKEVVSAQDLVESLSNATDNLVVVDFFSPGCGGCKALHPKMCQLAEMNPDIQFLQVNYEEHKSMCYSLNVHVLPFFRFYRGAEGRVCSFSCTNATIKKFKDALVKYGADRCGLGPPKGLEEKELLALAENRDLSFNYAPKPEEPVSVPLRAGKPPSHHPHSEFRLPLPRPIPSAASPEIKQLSGTDDRTFVPSGR
ncbi:PREDICTED: thioredoxin-like 1-2, chloroplastic isoform X1 [Ipomoea nil]|uniref:thioredoxin-like 1-2, chloroplastic isoform X1 n=1 Tax=Ipomoea nil TaxID=35883 RepID=UPI000901B552|nr:PREDICTED: thioredoxin-like 1-2, chloroplastic isoform X1 [Ipomoea nil]